MVAIDSLFPFASIIGIHFSIRLRPGALIFYMDNKEDDYEDCFSNIGSNFDSKAGFLPVLKTKYFFGFAGTWHTYRLRYHMCPYFGVFDVTF